MKAQVLIKKLVSSTGIFLLLILGQSMAAPLPMPKDRISDISNTKHNFSATELSSANRTLMATTESRICVFCHTPHNATNPSFQQAPLWNRALGGATSYTMYNSTSSDVLVSGAQPGFSSKLCLSCHDGTLAIGEVGVLNGKSNGIIDMRGTGPGGKMAEGKGVNTGFTSQLGGASGVDLTNDHPIGILYNSPLALADGELADPANTNLIVARNRGTKQPVVPLEPTIKLAPGQILKEGLVECVTCHDPHIRSTKPNENIKFLRLHRFQEQTPIDAPFDLNRDIGCIACHTKSNWANSAHAHPLVADETYSQTAADLREFGTSNVATSVAVWNASCLSCHDAHSVPGARWLLREGVLNQPVNLSPKQAGPSALEETCLGCHSSGGGVLSSQGNGTPVMDIRQDFNEPYRMPITSPDQAQTEEVHDIGSKDKTKSLWGKDFVEERLLLDNNKRHVECSDCHHPHRLTRRQLATEPGGIPDAKGTHVHEPGKPHTNLASGVLRGTWGVEPEYGSAGKAFMSVANSYLLKQGDPGSNTSTAVSSSYLTREYQVCLKCHSSYAYGNNPPLLGALTGGTSSADSFPPNMLRYTDQAMEFQAPLGHKGEVSTSDSGAAVGYSTNNHRSWHPVIENTGRSAAANGAFLAPFNLDLGNQTMYCADCHGSATAAGTVIPNINRSWGPHGSSKRFILKGTWDAATGTNQTEGLCFKCHNYADYADPSNTVSNKSGFSNTTKTNLHVAHANILGVLVCSNCHVAVPHGWKNKALLVNLNDVGPEQGLPANTSIPDAQLPYNNPPYYANARLKISASGFAASGNWQKANCQGCHLLP